MTAALGVTVLTPHCPGADAGGVQPPPPPPRTPTSPLLLLQDSGVCCEGRNGGNPTEL